jgi:hypothetical protein
MMEKKKNNPFKVPEGYFETFQDRLTDRIRLEEAEPVPVKRLDRRRILLAVAAAVAALALITIPLTRMLTPETWSEDSFVEIALLEGAGFFTSDYELAAYLEVAESSMDDENAYLHQAIEYLASADVGMDLIFE